MSGEYMANLNKKKLNKIKKEKEKNYDDVYHYSSGITVCCRLVGIDKFRYKMYTEGEIEKCTKHLMAKKLEQLLNE